MGGRLLEAKLEVLSSREGTLEASWKIQIAPRLVQAAPTCSKALFYTFSFCIFLYSFSIGLRYFCVFLYFLYGCYISCFSIYFYVFLYFSICCYIFPVGDLEANLGGLGGQGGGLGANLEGSRCQHAKAFEDELFSQTN